MISESIFKEFDAIEDAKEKAEAKDKEIMKNLFAWLDLDPSGQIKAVELARRAYQKGYAAGMEWRAKLEAPIVDIEQARKDYLEQKLKDGGP